MKEFKPLLEHLSANKPGPMEDNQPTVFPRVTIISDGRLDLCTQIVGPQGVQPLLDAMKHNSYICRLLLGNHFELILRKKQFLTCPFSEMAHCL